MIIKIICEDDIFLVDVPTTKPFSCAAEMNPLDLSPALKQTLEHYHKKYPIQRLDTMQKERQIFDLRGLWFTSENKFVEVVSEDEAYILQEDGKRLARCVVNNSDASTDLAGTLEIRRRGGEKKLSVLGHPPKDYYWPNLQSDNF